MRTEDDEMPPKLVFVEVKDQHEGKIQFRTRKSAQKQADNLMEKGRGFARVYECGSHYHLTSKRGKV